MSFYLDHTQNNQKKKHLISIFFSSVESWYGTRVRMTEKPIHTTHQEFEHVLGVRVDLDDVLFQGGDLRNVVIPPLTLLFLKLDGDSTDSTLLDTLHKMCHESVVK